jgi:outer membrane receptor for ferrienterochelin and colicins
MWRRWTAQVCVLWSLQISFQLSLARAEPEPAPASSGPAETADDVVITGTRSARRIADVPVATEVISALEIERSGAENAAEALETHAAIEIERALGGSGVWLQGLEPEYTLILVDGQRVGGRLNGAIDLTRFSAQEIERIEIVRGASSTLYGSDAIAGVINIITRRPTKPLQGDLHARYGSRNELDLSGSAAARGSLLSTRLSADFHRADAYDLDASDAATNGGSFDEAQAALDFELEFGSGFSLRTDATYRLRHQQAIDQGAGVAVFDREQRNEELRLFLQPRYELNAEDALTLSASYGDMNDQLLLDQRGQTALDRSDDTHNRLLQLTAQLDAVAFERHTLVAGVEVSYEWLRSSRLTESEAERNRLAVYVHDEWLLLAEPALTLVPGVRLDVDSRFGAHPTASLGVRFDVTDKALVRASYGLGFRAPDFKELYLDFENRGVGYVVEGNPDLAPETSRGLNAGLEYEPLPWLWFSLELFRTDLRDMIEEQPIDEPDDRGARRYRYANVASAHSQGITASARVRTEFGLTAELQQTFTDTWDEERDRAMEGRAKSRSALQLSYRLQPLELEASARALLVGPRPFYEADSETAIEETIHTDPYVSLRLRIAKRFGRWLSLFVGVENLLDAGDAAYLPIAPRTFYAGFTGRV